MFEGGCECGAVRYQMTATPIFVNCCHCRQCQRLTGSAFAMNAMIEGARVDVREGRGALEKVQGDATRCRECGVLLWATLPMFGEGMLFLRVGTLDEGERLRPDAHFFARSKHPWVSLPPNAPVFETLPSDRDPPLFGTDASARVEAVREGRLAPSSTGG
jgi:hypothetical protein